MLLCDLDEIAQGDLDAHEVGLLEIELEVDCRIE